MLALLPAAASGAPLLGAPTTWDGTIPFNCTLQQAGFQALGPNPGADPYCVEFDKRRQSVLPALGIVDFLLKEPARVAAAVNKCFYFQADHWRGALIQDDPRTELWSWDGRYFFDKARGDGGVYIANLRILGRPIGTFGYRTHNDIPADPRCAAIARANPGAVYAAP